MKPSLLIVDDDQNIRLLYKHKLQSEGYQIDLASSGSETFDKIKSSSYDLIILDIEMPGISGLELISRLREETPDTRIIINSAYSTYKADFRTWLADAYLVKSSDLEPLKNEIIRQLEKENEID